MARTVLDMLDTCCIEIEEKLALYFSKAYGRYQ